MDAEELVKSVKEIKRRTRVPPTSEYSYCYMFLKKKSILVNLPMLKKQLDEQMENQIKTL